MHYNHVNIDLNKKAIDDFDWKKALEGCYPNKQVNILTDNVLNIMSNFILNKNIIDDRDPPYINKKIKGLIHERNLVSKKHLKKINSDIQRAFYQIQDQLRLAIGNSKLKYYQKLSNKLSNDIYKDKC